MDTVSRRPLRSVESLLGTPGGDTLIGDRRAEHPQGEWKETTTSKVGAAEIRSTAGEVPTSSTEAAGATHVTKGKTFEIANGLPSSTGPPSAWDDSHKGEPLDLTWALRCVPDRRLQFAVHRHGRTCFGAGPWYAPARPDTSVAHFRLPVGHAGNVPPSRHAGGAHDHHAERGWILDSGHMQTVNNLGEGFSLEHATATSRRRWPSRRPSLLAPLLFLALHAHKPYEGPDESLAPRSM